MLDIWELAKVRNLEVADDLLTRLTAGLILITNGHGSNYSFTFKGDRYRLKIVKDTGFLMTLNKNGEDFLSTHSDRDTLKETFQDFFKYLQQNLDI